MRPFWSCLQPQLDLNLDIDNGGGDDNDDNDDDRPRTSTSHRSGPTQEAGVCLFGSTLGITSDAYLAAVTCSRAVSCLLNVDHHLAFRFSLSSNSSNATLSRKKRPTIKATMAGPNPNQATLAADTPLPAIKVLALATLSFSIFFVSLLFRPFLPSSPYVPLYDPYYHAYWLCSTLVPRTRPHTCR